MPQPYAVALITGASKGIGEELARQFARHEYDLVLVARNEKKLRDLAQSIEQESGQQVVTIGLDLSLPQAASILFERLAGDRIDIEVLVNNVGLLHNGEFADIPAEDHKQLLTLNIGTLTELTHCFLRPMLQRGSGKVLNVASLSAFQPVPRLCTYAASKAYVLSFTEALSEELKDTGVTVTALCPGFASTDMVTGESDGNNLQLPNAFLMSAKQVAAEGYRACEKGTVVHVPGLSNKLVAGMAELQPRLVRRRTAGLMSRLFLAN